MPERSTVLVTGIGGNVGQGILRILRQRFPDLRLVGTDINAFTAGHRFCDAFRQVPYSYDPGYLEAMTECCRAEQVDLVIPSTDYEVYHLGLAAGRLPRLIASPPDLARVFLDKYLTWQRFTELGLPFAASHLPSTYGGEFPRVIVKPREGRGSRDLHRDPAAPRAFDDTFVVQELLEGVELTTAFYVTRQRRLHGQITFTRTLASGMTQSCEVTPRYDDLVLSVLRGMVEHLDIRGPCNVQSIVTADGRLVPFEINGRYSGTSSIRSQLGFCDVAFGIQEYLLERDPEAPQVQAGAAVRIYLDIIYPGQSLASLAPGDQGSHLF